MRNKTDVLTDFSTTDPSHASSNLRFNRRSPDHIVKELLVQMLNVSCAIKLVIQRLVV